MNKFLILLLLPLTLFAHMNIAVSYPYIGAITKSIGGEHINTVVLAKGNWDPHFVVPRPSLISKMRNADALIMNGGQLEIGWLPALLRRAGNPKTNVGSNSFLNLSHHVELINKPSSVDRANGDIHPDGNPHFHLDPQNIIVLAKTIQKFLISLDSEHADVYNKNYEQFSASWKENMKVWQEKMANKKGMKVIQFHNNLAYFNKAYSLNNIGTIEPLPGIPPSSRHIIDTIKLINDEKPCCVLHDVYHSTKTAEFIREKTGIKIVLMPHDIGALDNIEDLTSLFDYLTGAIK
ncbi:ABC transporter, periplasmic substrate binding protein [Sulfurimonas gotlandica GD1]|uniref:ABC transporter, periplasmic substrate binding protein n=1 Tax=Sulfurimonas gotlandica (strain DSM 19862 / JCM 16533 / GD1) TaxID=929558 RepID=B6BH56_SULGG|nr:metal ABC transporter substrate-binding protein [Sulfurimonas gotlandica]EDZ63226.1 periplasmic solute binding protein [Sulfurimonas gotlandica GD1]EHP29845.1 ABC transporter, periplasmic substrate binding protein [Sulfurimonas gotlandica GD1]